MLINTSRDPHARPAEGLLFSGAFSENPLTMVSHSQEPWGYKDTRTIISLSLNSRGCQPPCDGSQGNPDMEEILPQWNVYFDVPGACLPKQVIKKSQGWCPGFLLPSRQLQERFTKLVPYSVGWESQSLTLGVSISLGESLASRQSQLDVGRPPFLSSPISSEATIYKSIPTQPLISQSGG